MWTLLFDIDGTLIRTGGAGMSAIELTMMKLFGIAQIPAVPVHGRTDYGIIVDLFRPFSISVDEHIEHFKETYWGFLTDSLMDRGGVVLPGVHDLLNRLQACESVALGLITGNTARSAAIKLTHFGLDSYFDFGGYGDHHADRNDVARQAKQAAAEHLGDDFDPGKIWVIGDTANDIRCARSIGSRVVALETGGCEPEELRQANPDLQLSSLIDQDEFVRQVLSSSE